MLRRFRQVALATALAASAVVLAPAAHAGRVDFDVAIGGAGYALAFGNAPRVVYVPHAFRPPRVVYRGPYLHRPPRVVYRGPYLHRPFAQPQRDHRRDRDRD